MAERRYTLVFYAAVLTAVAATYGVYRVLELTKAQAKVPMQQVVVAAQDVTEGATLDRMVLTVNDWPAPTVPAGAYSSLDSVAGRVTRVAVFKGEPIVPGRLAPAGTGPGLEVKITPGKRAMSIRIDDVTGLNGLIQPNSRVDLMVTIRDTSTNHTQVAKLFMENMRVLSIGTQVQRGAENQPIAAGTATLEVTPEEAEQLAIAMREGYIQLVLRGYGDPDSIKTRGAYANDVLAQLRSAPAVRIVEPVRQPPRASRPRETPRPRVEQIVTVPAVPRRPDSLTVQVFRGNAVTSQKFETKAAPAPVPQANPEQ